MIAYVKLTVFYIEELAIYIYKFVQWIVHSKLVYLPDFVVSRLISHKPPLLTAPVPIVAAAHTFTRLLIYIHQPTNKILIFVAGIGSLIIVSCKAFFFWRYLKHKQ